MAIIGKSDRITVTLFLVNNSGNPIEVTPRKTDVLVIVETPENEIGCYIGNSTGNFIHVKESADKILDQLEEE